jgi:cold shock CspA family protein
MSTQRYQGEIIRWKEDKGFGFIKTPSIEKDIFLHISAIRNRQRQPTIGDTIYFDLKFEEQGKLKAINASFNENSTALIRSSSNCTNSVPKQSNKKTKKLNLQLLASVGLVVLVVSVAAFELIKQSKCNIKGNISYPSGEKLYHKPSYRDYAKVEVFTNEGERWFCSEQEAINAGWQDAAKYAR